MINKFKIFAYGVLGLSTLIVTNAVVVAGDKKIEDNLKVAGGRESSSLAVSEVEDNGFKYSGTDQPPKSEVEAVFIPETSTDVGAVFEEVRLEEFEADKCLVTRADWEEFFSRVLNFLQNHRRIMIYVPLTGLFLFSTNILPVLWNPGFIRCQFCEVLRPILLHKPDCPLSTGYNPRRPRGRQPQRLREKLVYGSVRVLGEVTGVGIRIVRGGFGTRYIWRMITGRRQEESVPLLD